MRKFRNREDAAIQLVQKLQTFKNTDSIVLAIPRGGIPIGYILSKALNLPLEPILSKKIGHPFNPEFAIGSVTLFGSVLDSISGIHPDYIRHEEEMILKTLKEKFSRYMGQRTPAILQDKTVILVDDGIATGNTLYAATKAIKTQQPKAIVIAVPVSSASASLKLSQPVTSFISLITTEKFSGVAQFYMDFSEVSDEEVMKLLKQ